MDAVKQEVSSGADWKRLGPAGMRAFFGIAKKWDLSVHEQLILLGQPSKQTLYNWREGKGTDKLTLDQVDRLSYILGIYKALHLLHKDRERADDWLQRPNQDPRFAGKRPLDALLRGSMSDLANMRRFLDGARG